MDEQENRQTRKTDCGPKSLATRAKADTYSTLGAKRATKESVTSHN